MPRKMELITPKEMYSLASGNWTRISNIKKRYPKIVVAAIRRKFPTRKVIVEIKDIFSLGEFYARLDSKVEPPQEASWWRMRGMNHVTHGK